MSTHDHTPEALATLLAAQKQAFIAAGAVDSATRRRAFGGLGNSCVCAAISIIHKRARLACFQCKHGLTKIQADKSVTA